MEPNANPQPQLPQGWKIGSKASGPSVDLQKITPTDETVKIDALKSASAQNQIAEKLSEKEVGITSDVNLENIMIPKRPDAKIPEFGSADAVGDKIKIRPSKAAIHIEQIMASYIFICLFLVVIVVSILFNKFVDYSLTPTPENQSYVDKGKSAIKFVSQYTNIDDYAQWYDRTDVTTNASALKSLVSSDRLNYLEKRDIMKRNVPTLAGNISSNAETLDSLKKEILQYGFIPQELYGYIETRESLGGLKKRIALIENIKFVTAVKVLSYMQSFIQSFASYIGKDPSYVDKELRNILVGIEKDIMIYTNACFLNPYELTQNCDTVGDFENFYRMIDTQRLTTLDIEFIRKLVPYVNSKLDETGVPIFSINFNKFDPRSKSLDFTMSLSTNSQDEYALNRQGILNPHVYVATNLVNLLRQSLLVIGEGISANQIKISPRTVKVGNTIFSINTSSMGLSLPIQKSTQREISDFFNTNN